MGGTCPNFFTVTQLLTHNNPAEVLVSTEGNIISKYTGEPVLIQLKVKLPKSSLGATFPPKLLISSTQMPGQRSPHVFTKAANENAESGTWKKDVVLKETFSLNAEQNDTISIFHAKRNGVSVGTCRHLCNIVI